MLSWIFGDVKQNIVHINSHDCSAGYLEFDSARVRWFLSINSDVLQDKIKAKGQTTYRSITIEGEEFETIFPLLFKFIDANDDLSIQLHPNDELAAKRHNSFGKTEMWYVVDADEDARLIVGFNGEYSKEAYINELEADNLLHILNTVSIKKGDDFFIEVGTIHAIGKGSLVAEIQQTSDITYRVFDWNRKDDFGNEFDFKGNRINEL